MQLARRAFKEGEELSLIGLGGMTLAGMEQGQVNRLVYESLDSGVNFIDVAPHYGAGTAEAAVGCALLERRRRIFLSSKTLARDAAGAAADLAGSLERLRTDYVDLYQLHALATVQDVERVAAPGGALETLFAAREDGWVRFLGFSAHSEEAALSMLDRYPLDAMMFPVNYLCFAAGFGPRVIARACTEGVACIALKATAAGRWLNGERRDYPNCWYRPIDDRAAARQALRFALSKNVTALLPPGDERLYRWALEDGLVFQPLNEAEMSELLATPPIRRPLFHPARPRRNPDRIW